jgi:hypothetical protein
MAKSINAQLDRASQGITDKQIGKATAVPQKSGSAIIRSAGRVRQTKPRASTERVTQDWKRG